MTEVEKKETLARIEVAEKELAELKAKVQSDDEVPDELDDIDKPLEIDSCDTVYYVTEAGTISIMYGASTNVPFYNVRHRAFKQLKYAEIYREKTQFIADLLHFKWLYDRDYEPDWSDDRERKYFVVGYHDVNNWVVDYVTRGMVGGVYFSSEAIAQKCADWLKRRAGII